MLSLWMNECSLPAFKSLDGDMKTDVLIIGGGIAGILCAYYLHRSGVDYILTEADRICRKVTANTTAKITFQHGFIYDKLIRRYGADKAKLYLDANRQALNEYTRLCEDIDCDFEKKDATVYSLNDKSKCRREIKALKKLDYKAFFNDNVNLPFSVAGAVTFKDQAQFNPLKFIGSIAAGLNIYEKTPIEQLVGTKAYTGKHSIRAKKIVIATHFPILNKHGSYFIKMFQQRSYVIALKNAPDVNRMYIDGSGDGLSFRNYKDLLLIGGGGHRTGKNGGNYKVLREFAEKHFPQAEEVYHWATQDCITLDSMPYIGQYSASTPDLYVTTGFNKWGMTSSMAGALLLRDIICGKKNPYENLFSPSRSILHPQLAINGFEALAGLLTPSPRRCPHLGCVLKWNPCERTWDCPCHGSRFTENGNLLDGPATGDLKHKK